MVTRIFVTLLVSVNLLAPVNCGYSPAVPATCSAPDPLATTGQAEMFCVPGIADTVWYIDYNDQKTYSEAEEECNRATGDSWKMAWIASSAERQALYDRIKVVSALKKEYVVSLKDVNPSGGGGNRDWQWLTPHQNAAVYMPWLNACSNGGCGDCVTLDCTSDTAACKFKMVNCGQQSYAVLCRHGGATVNNEPTTQAPTTAAPTTTTTVVTTTQAPTTTTTVVTTTQAPTTAAVTTTQAPTTTSAATTTEAETTTMGADCSDPGNITNTNRSPAYQSAGFSEGDTVTYTCDQCSFLEGETSKSFNRTCSNNAWNNERNCSRYSCSPPGNVTNAVRSGTGELCGDNRQYQCYPGFKIWSEGRWSHTHTSTCQADGQWSNPATECVEDPVNLGCVQPTDTSWASSYTTVTGTRTVDACRTHCKDQGMAYSILAYGNRCLCSKPGLSHFNYVTERARSAEYTEDQLFKCNQTCPGSDDSYEYCGNSHEDYYSLYDTMIHTTWQLPSGNGLTTRMSNAADSLNYPEMSPQICSRYCYGKSSNYSYVLVWQWDCYCMEEADTDLRDIVDKVANCSYNAENCGGTDRVFGYPLSEEPYVSSCQDVYNAGLWIHGTYYSSDSSSFYCNIKENSTACDQGWISHGGHCYKLTHVQKNFDQAIQACAADNAHLVTVNSASEMNFLKNLIPTRPSLLYEWYFFIGFYDFADTKASTWLDGALSKYKYFHGVAPNTFGYKCNILMRSQHYKWRDWLCTETEGYICEKSPEYIGCFDRVQDGEVVLTNSKMSIQYCRQTCMAKSYDYAALLNGNACHCVTNDGTNATAFDLHSPLPMTSCSTPCLANDKQYCGAANKFNVYQASGLSSPEYAQSCYELEMAGLPSGEYIIKPSGGSPSTVNCTMESDGLCSVGWIGHNGHCYLFSAGFNSFTNVRAICKARDATMVTLDDVTEGTFLYNVRANVPALYDNSAYWHVGGYATAGYHHYQWNDGRLMKYSTWMSGQPNLHTQLCLAADMQNPPQLLDLRCTDNRHYVCEKYGGYKGCYGVASTSYRVLANIPSLTVQQCIETCRGKNKAFAGLKQKSCYCFDSIVTPTQAHSVCDVACEGGAYQNCGGTGNGMSMYQIDKYPSLADSCEDLYDQGIRISGDYKIQRYGETFIQTCTFYENNPDCPSGFIRWRGECYKFVTSAASWNAANGACLNSGAEMLSILNSEEWDFVQSTLTGIQYNAAKAGWYTGLRDPFGAKQHTWSDGHLLTWKPHSIQGTANQCVQLKRYHTNGNSYNAASYLWTYVSCTTSLPYICKIPRDVIGCVPKPPDSKRTLVKYAGAMSNSLCRQICRGQNSTYAATNANLCTCYNDLTQSERQAVAKAGCSVQCPGNDGQRCGHASPERVTLNDVGVTCPADWVLENDRCYYHDNSTWVKYYDAYLHCRDYGVGGTILSVNTQAESDFSNTLNISDTWIGLSKLTASSSWKWDDGSSASWTNWAANQPGTEKCVTQNETGSWRTTPCSETHPVTCEKPAGSPDALPSTCDNLYNQRLTLSGTYLLSGGHETCGITDSSRCPDGVSYAFGRSCYEFVLSGRTFESARQHCVSHGKQLYSPDTGEDAAMLRNAISKITELAEVNNWFIGLYDLDLDHHYTTIDGSALFYYNWAATEPRSNYQRCVRWGDTGTWFSEDCATSLPFICETNSGYQGCYNVPSSTSGYRNKAVYPRMTLMTCRKYCRGLERPQLYAGVSGQTCYCMSSLTTSKVADSACDAVCPGNPVQTCGDNGVMTVLVTVMYNIREASCEDLYNQGVVMPGWYRIFPRGHGSMARVYCHGQERANDFLLPSVQDSDIAVSPSEGTTGSGAISYDGSYGRLFQESATLYDAWRPTESDNKTYASVTLPEASYITGFVTRKPLNWLEKFQPATNGFNFPVPELDLSGLTSLTFEVKSCKHIGMLLTTSAEEAARGSQGYKIMIDKSDGTSIIQLNKNSEVKVRVTNTKIANCAEYKAFWVSWANGVIRAGAGRRVGTGTIMSWTDSQRRYTVKSLALLTWGSFPGLHWRFPLTEPQGLVYAFIRAPDSGASKNHVAGVDLSNSTFLSFSVRGCYNANIMLAESATEAESGTEGYYIIIGGSSGTSASIKRSFSQSGSNAATTTSSRLTNCTEYLSYWVSWRDGLIELGTGLQYGVGAFLNWTDSNPRTVTALAISTKAGSSGIEFEINAPESTQSYSSRLLYGDSENDLTYYDATNDSTQAVTFDGSSVPYQLVYQYLEKPKVAKHVRLEFDNTDRVRFDILGVPLSQFTQDKGHVGCFVESADGTDLDLPFLVGNLPNATACMLSCEAQGYRYAGIAGGVNCSCGTTIGRYGMVKDYECNVQCPNMPGYKCGGTGRNSIYQIWETTCPEVPSVQFATPNTTDRVHNTVVSYTCNPGYIKPEGFYSADKVVTCRQTTWTGELPSPCRPIECNSTVPSLPHSTVNWTDITYLSTATYTCDTGYALPDGSTTHVAHCQISEEWGPLRHCQPVACPATSTFTNNVQTITGTGTSYGSIVTYVCNQGYVVPNTRIMQQRMTCQQWGNWSSTAVDCTADFTFVGCFANSGGNQLNAISIDVSTINDNTVTNYVDKCRKHCLSNGFPIAGMVNGDTCKCAASYDTSASPLPSTSCNTACTGGDPGFWCGGSGTNNIMIFKTANQCPPLTLTLATANTSLHAIGTVVGITCDPGYMFRDTEATTRVTECLANELWSDGVQSCMGKCIMGLQW